MTSNVVMHVQLEHLSCLKTGTEELHIRRFFFQVSRSILAFAWRVCPGSLPAGLDRARCISRRSITVHATREEHLACI